MPTHICFDNQQYLHGLLNSKNNTIAKLIIKLIKSLLNTFAAKHLKTTIPRCQACFKDS